MSEEAGLIPGVPHPVRGQQLRLLLTRPQPLHPDEHRGLAALAVRAVNRGWRSVASLRLMALDGPAGEVAAAFLTYGDPDLDLVELPQVLALLDDLEQQVPGCGLSLHDPAALLGRLNGRFSLPGTDGGPLQALPALDPAWRPDPREILLPPADLPEPAPADAAAAPRTEGELADLLQVIARVGPQRGLLRAGAAPGVRHLGRLEALASAGVLGGAAVALLADLARRELVEGDALEDIAERLIETGDRTERAAARDLMAVLRRSTVAEKTDPWVEGAPGAATWPLVEALGSALLARPSLDTGGDSEGPQWEDDLLGDDLLLLDPDTEVPESPLGQAIRSLPEAHRMEAARGLLGQPDFARLALGALSGSDPAAAGACLLLSQQIWPPNAIPGLLAALGRVAASDRAWPVRALAAQAAAGSGRSDAAPLLIALLQDPEPVVARTAVRGLGQVPGEPARRAVRAALDEPRLAAHALAAAGDAGDAGAFGPALSRVDHEDADIRRAAARHLDRIGGRRALPALKRLHAEDASWQVQLEAAGALARQASVADLRELLESDDADVLARVVRALGEADRADAFALLEQAARHLRSSVREAAAEAIGNLGLPSGTAPLLEMLSDANPDVRLSALRALARCGDRRAVHSLRRQAGRRDETGATAHRSLRSGRLLRLPPPDGRVRLRALAENPLSTSAQQEIREALLAVGLSATCTDRSLEASGTIEARDLADLSAVAAAIEALDRANPGLRWSVRDGLSAIRQAGRRWTVSATQGAVARAAGWFEESLPAPSERPPLTPIAGMEAGFVPLPVSVVRHVKGREQVRIAVDPRRAGDPNETTGDVPGTPAPPVGNEDEDIILDEVEDLVAEDPQADEATGAMKPPAPSQPRPRSGGNLWEDLLSEGRAPAALQALAARGLEPGEPEQLLTWLGSGLPGIMVAACRVALATDHRAAVPAIAGAADHSDRRVRITVAEALGALGAEQPGLAGETLASLAADPDAPVQEAARLAQAHLAGAATAAPSPAPPTSPPDR